MSKKWWTDLDLKNFRTFRHNTFLFTLCMKFLKLLKLLNKKKRTQWHVEGRSPFLKRAAIFFSIFGFDGLNFAQLTQSNWGISCFSKNQIWRGDLGTTGRHGMEWPYIIVPYHFFLNSLTILGPMCFLPFINDLSERVTSSIKLFANDCELYRTIKKKSDYHKLQLYPNQPSGMWSFYILV